MGNRFEFGGVHRQRNSPCKDCTRRVVGCHSACEDYSAYKQELTLSKAEADKEKNKNVYWLDYCKDQIDKKERKKRNKHEHYN